MSLRLGPCNFLKVLGAWALLALLPYVSGCQCTESAAPEPQAKPAPADRAGAAPQPVAAEAIAAQPAPAAAGGAKAAAPAAGTPLGRDPQNLYGSFDNGFKYIIRKNTNPPGRVALFLHVDTGALNETPAQNGLAHFLEHMAFNGSKNFAPGTLIPFMNKLGMSFGADSNAHTNHHETVYKLFMPDNTDSSLDTALKIFEDYATGLLLLEEEIEKERKVVLGEMRAHKGPAQRLQDELTPLLFPNTKIAAHDVIGKDEILTTAKRAEFVDYWNAWYRPERMTLIVVGEIDDKRVIAKAKAAFGGMTARSQARKPSNTGIRRIDEARAFVLSDVEQVSAEVRILAIAPGRPNIETEEAYRFNEVENLGNWIMNRRFADLVQRGEAEYQGASSVVSGFYEDAIVPMTAAIGEPEDWAAILEQLIVENNRALQHGFGERELNLAKEDLLSSARHAVDTEGTLNASALINMISGSIGYRRPLLSARQNLEILERMLPTVTVAEVQKVFDQNYATRSNSYVVVLPKREGLALPAKEDVLAAASAAWSRKTEPLKEEAAALSLLESLPEPGTVASEETDEELGVTTIKFANGAILHHRFMDYKKDQVIVTIAFPGGTMEETAENRGVSQVASQMNATSRLSSSQLRDLLTGKNVQIGGNITIDQVVLSIFGDPQDLEVGFQQAYAMITDGRIEQSAFDNWKESELQAIERAKSLPQAQLQEAMIDAVHGADLRLKRLTAEQIDRLSPEQGEAWARRLVERGPVEVAVVGDISLEAARDQVARYVGSLPKATRDAKELVALRKVARGNGPYVKRVDFDSITPKALAFAGFIGSEERDVVDRRLLALASKILSDRMLREIREEKQLVYSIGCSHAPGVGLQGMGRIAAGADPDPDKAEQLADTILEMMDRFAKDGPTQEEVDVGRLQILTQLETQMKEPGFWISQLSDMHYRGKTFAEMKELVAAYKGFTRDQVHDVAKRYFTAERRFRVLAVPGGSAPVTAEADEEAAVEGTSAPAGK